MSTTLGTTSDAVANSLEFPRGFAGGLFAFEGGQWRRVATAMGKVAVPDGSLRLTVSQPAARLLDKFSPETAARITSLSFEPDSLCDASILRKVTRFGNLTELLIERCGLVGSPLRELSTMEKLDYLSLRDSTLNCGSLEGIAQLANLKGLHLGGTNTIDKDLREISTLRLLKSLMLDHTLTGDASLHWLTDLEDLRKLSLNGRVTDAAAVILPDLAKIEILLLTDTATTAATLHAIKSLSALRMLALSARINGDDADAFAGFGSVEALFLPATSFSPPGFAALRHWSSLQALHIASVPTWQDMGELAGLPYLSKLALANPAIPLADLWRLREFPSLEILELDAPLIGDDCIQVFLEMPRLHTLSFRRSGLTVEGQRVLREAIPRCRIFHPGVEVQAPARENFPGLVRLRYRERPEDAWVETSPLDESIVIPTGCELSLTVEHSPALRFGALLSAKDMKIVELRVADTLVDEASAKGLSSLANLVTFELLDATVAQEACEAFGALKELRSLDLTGSAQAAGIVAALDCADTLERLVLVNTRLDDPSVANLSRLRNLTSLSLRLSGLSEAQKAEVAAALPGARVE